ncbi:MAG: hypothetical protein MI919_31220, partial [Holophagales bacterium]|nr:hypothetical protein [Holophagales bacterium]
GANSTVDRWRHGQEIQPHTDRAKVPEKLHSLIVLLYDEDLHTFLELLLGSVLKRASLTVRKEMEAQAPPEVMESLLDSIQVVQPEEVATQIQGRAPQEPGSPGPASHGFADPGMAQGPGLGPADGAARIDFHALPDGEEPTQQIGVGREAWDSSTLDAELDSLSSPGFDEIPAVQAYKVDDGPPATDLAGRQQMMGALEELEGMIDRLTSPSTPSLRSFQLIQRLLKQNRSIPPAMLQSMQPYLFDMMNELLPRLEHGPLAPRFGKLGGELVRDCQLLCRPQLGPELLRGPVPEAMQRITNLLQELRTRVAEAMEELSGY